jgi:hypothetical protein
MVRIGTTSSLVPAHDGKPSRARTSPLVCSFAPLRRHAVFASTPERRTSLRSASAIWSISFRPRGFSPPRRLAPRRSRGRCCSPQPAGVRRLAAPRVDESTGRASYSAHPEFPDSPDRHLSAVSEPHDADPAHAAKASRGFGKAPKCPTDWSCRLRTYGSTRDPSSTRRSPVSARFHRSGGALSSTRPRGCATARAVSSPLSVPTRRSTSVRYAQQPRRAIGLRSQRMRSRGSKDMACAASHRSRRRAQRMRTPKPALHRAAEAAWRRRNDAPMFPYDRRRSDPEGPPHRRQHDHRVSPPGVPPPVRRNAVATTCHVLVVVTPAVDRSRRRRAPAVRADREVVPCVPEPTSSPPERVFPDRAAPKRATVVLRDILAVE